MSGDNEADQPAQASHLFTLRFWPEDLGSGQTDWRGKAQHVNSGEARYFRDWPTLEAFVEGLLRGGGAADLHPDAAERSSDAS